MDKKPFRAGSKELSIESMVTMKDIANEVGVSRPTVSHVLNGRSKIVRIGKETEKRIFETAKKMGYCRNEIARSVKTGKTSIIGFIARENYSEPSASLLDGIMKAAAENNYFVKVFSPDSGQTASQIAETCFGQRLDGVISYGLSDKDFLQGLADFLNKRQIPLAVASGSCKANGAAYVSPDNEMAGRLAFEHLYSLGHREFALSFKKPDAPSLNARLDGFIKAAAEAGINIPDHHRIKGFFFREADIKEIFMKPSRPTAAYCLGDSNALSLMTKLLCDGVKVPSEISIVGHGNLSFSTSCTPSITTINEDLKGVGSRAFNLLLENIESKNSDFSNYSEKTKVELIARESTGKANPEQLSSN